MEPKTPYTFTLTIVYQRKNINIPSTPILPSPSLSPAARRILVSLADRLLAFGVKPFNIRLQNGRRDERRKGFLNQAVHKLRPDTVVSKPWFFPGLSLNENKLNFFLCPIELKMSQTLYLHFSLYSMGTATKSSFNWKTELETQQKPGDLLWKMLISGLSVDFFVF